MSLALHILAKNINRAVRILIVYRERHWNADEKALDPATSKTFEISDSSKLAVPLSLHVRGNKSCAVLECLIARETSSGKPEVFSSARSSGRNSALKSLSRENGDRPVVGPAGCIAGDTQARRCRGLG